VHFVGFYYTKSEYIVTRDAVKGKPSCWILPCHRQILPPSHLPHRATFSSAVTS